MASPSLRPAFLLWPDSAVSRVDSEATAVGEREVRFDISFAAAWPLADPDGETSSG